MVLWRASIVSASNDEANFCRVLRNPNRNPNRKAARLLRLLTERSGVICCLRTEEAGSRSCWFYCQHPYTLNG